MNCGQSVAALGPLIDGMPGTHESSLVQAGIKSWIGIDDADWWSRGGSNP